MSKRAATARQELRRSNAAVPHRNRYRERKSGQDDVRIHMMAGWGAPREGGSYPWEPSEEGRDWED